MQLFGTLYKFDLSPSVQGLPAPNAGNMLGRSLGARATWWICFGILPYLSLAHYSIDCH